MKDLLESHASGTPMSDEQFRARMLAQCQEIKQYRLTVERREGRCLSLNQAAVEWISRHAESFDARHPSVVISATPGSLS